LAADLERLIAERTRIAEELEERLRRRYELIFERKGGLAVVEVRKATAAAAGRVAPRLITQIHNSDIVFCETAHPLRPAWTSHRARPKTHPKSRREPGLGCNRLERRECGATVAACRVHEAR
jgi:hypothetical protein